MNQIKKLITLVYIIFTIPTVSCNLFESDSDLINKMNTLERRDSLSISHVAKTWVDSSFMYFSDHKEPPFNLRNGKVEVIVLTGFYSPDRKKILSWFTEKVPNNDGFATDSGYYYFSNCMLGIRDDTSKIFKFGIFDQQMCEAAELEWIINCMSKYFFNKMKKDFTRIYAKYYNSYYGGNLGSKDNLNTDKSIYQEFGYNLQEPEFWERSLIWYKGSKIKGYDNFDLAEWATPSDTITNRDVFIRYPKISYPDSILKLYSR
jgi:hypothetical protein